MNVVLTQKSSCCFGNTATNSLTAPWQRDRFDACFQGPGKSAISAINPPDRQIMKSDDVTISWYENEVPAFVESEMERLYGNIFSSMLQFRISGSLAGNTSTYVARKGDRTVAIFLFRRDGGMVRVMNEAIKVDSEQLHRFTDTIFAKYSSVNIISFNAIETDVHRMTVPYQRFNCLEDMTLALPGTVDDYVASLGKNTRRNIKRYMERLKRNHPSYRFEVCEKDAMSAQRVREIVGFNKARMAGKNIVSDIDESETQRITDLLKGCGLVGMITIDGRVCAGAMSYQQGANYFLNVLAHRPDYDDCALGFLCCYLTICECIARGGREFHFLWGRYDYKYTLGAVRRDLDNVVVYRTRTQFLRNADVAWQVARAGYLRRAKVWVKYEDSVMSRFARNIINRLRALNGSAADSFAAPKQVALSPGQET
jgi:hypothetical protein